jgi:CheY-specific phosphatase CheX
MIPTESQIRDVVHRFWSTQLDLTIQDADRQAEAVAPHGIHTMTAAVHISGDFLGGIRVECTRTLVRRVAAVMFDRGEDDLTEDDERDVIGEIANVFAGNVKALIPGSSSISLPTVIDGSDYTVASLDVASLQAYGFVHDGEPMVVTILEHRGS